MKSKNINRILAIAAVAVTLSACDNYIDVRPISDNTDETAYITAKDAEAALVGVYDSFSQEYYIWDNILISDVRSDNYYAGGDDANIFQYDNLAVATTNGRLFNDWTQLYNAILKANVVLKRVPEIADKDLTDERRSQILGEAYFLRAYHYYNLVKTFGGVPLITTPTTSTEPSQVQIARSTEAEVYTQIISDLGEAVQRLPDTYGADASVNKARATKAAANALLAKVYAQNPAGRDYDKVNTYCDAVINSPAGYSLMPSFDQLWDGSHYNNQESIMEVQFTGGTEGNWGPQLLLPPSITATTWRKFIVPSHDLVNAFDAEGDAVRKGASILFEVAPWADEYWSPTVGGSIPFAYKWRDAGGGNSTNRQYIFRLADIILLKAEAINSKGDVEGARALVDQIRDRVGLDPTPATNQSEMQLAIEKERRLELAQEGQRWDDLVRYGRVESVMNALNEVNLVTGQKKVYDMQPYKRVMPIPQQERNLNKTLGQNDQY